MNRIKEKIYRFFPYCNVFISDKNYYFPAKEEIEWLLSESGFEKYQYQKEIFDCDDYSLILHAFVRQEQYINKDWDKPWAFGEAWGDKFKGETKDHAVNIAITEKGILLIEPQTDEIWDCNLDNDNIYFIRM